MVNRQPRTPGDIRRYQSQAQIGGQLPSAVVEGGGEVFRALEGIGATLGARLKGMADRARSSEGTRDGTAAGASAGAKYVEKAGLETRGKARAPAKGKTPAADAAAPGVPAAVTPGLNGQPLQLRHDNTIYGEAFDAAAFKTYGWRLQAGLGADLMAAAEANQDSPGGYEAAIAKLKDGYLTDPMLADPEVREIFDRQFVERVAPARLAIAARHEAKVKADLQTAALDGVEGMRHELERNAYNLGANPAGDWMMQPLVRRALNTIDGGIADGTFTPKQGEAFKAKVTATVRNARTEGTFAALPTPAAKQDFALSIMEDYAAGKGPFGELGLEEAQSLSDTLYRRATSEQNRLTAETRGQQAEVEQLIADDLTSIAATGEGLDRATSGLDSERVTTLLGEEALQSWATDRQTATRTWEATAGMELESPAELAARLEALKPQAGSPGFATQQAIFEVATDKAGDVLEERQSDPLGQAARGGLITLEAIDTTSAEALVASIGKRRGEAMTVAQTYGTPLTVFRPAERQALAQGLLDQPEFLPAFSLAVADTFGDVAPQVLGELSEAGPELAHAAGIMLGTANNSVAADVATVLTMRRDKTLKVKMPEDGTLSNVASQIVGPALTGATEQRAAIIGTANLLFELDANRLGLDVSAAAIKDPETASFAAYRRAINRALGSRVIDGVQWGGLSEVNGAPIVAPSFLPADAPQELLGSLSAAELALLPPIQSANGVAVSASQLNGAHLVTIGDGIYRVALGDPDGFDPQYLATPAGDYWTLNLEDLAAIRRRRVTVPGLLPFGLGGQTVTMPERK